jgi:hypothetical protein
VVLRAWRPVEKLVPDQVCDYSLCLQSLSLWMTKAGIPEDYFFLMLWLWVDINSTGKKKNKKKKQE